LRKREKSVILCCFDLKTGSIWSSYSGHLAWLNILSEAKTKIEQEQPNQWTLKVKQTDNNFAFLFEFVSVSGQRLNINLNSLLSLCV
jgi:hypothetical protein